VHNLAFSLDSIADYMRVGNLGEQGNCLLLQRFILWPCTAGLIGPHKLSDERPLP
jgi:hypothetical protein